jgi:DnaJ-class molecular chaperone
MDTDHIPPDELRPPPVPTCRACDGTGLRWYAGSGSETCCVCHGSGEVRKP